MKYDIIYEGKFYYKGEIVEGCIGVEDGIIKKIAKNIEGEKVRIEGTLLPAMVDMHVHFREPGFEYKEDFLSGSMCAVLGGVSFVADMPNNRPRMDRWENISEKFSRVRKRSFVDYELYAEISKNTDYYLLKNHNLFKIYTYENPVEEIAEKFEYLDENDLVSFHCEDSGCLREGDARNLKEYCFLRPERCEISAVKKILALPKKFRKHIAHISTPDSVDIALASNFTKEITPHHLLFDYTANLGAFGKVNPPLRSPGTREILWKMFVDGDIEVIASDHAPHTPDEKDDFETSLPGMPGVETTYPIFLNLFRERKISLRRLLDAIAYNPAKILGIPKGRIKEGYHADFVAIHLGDWERITERKLHYKCGWSPYIGFYAIFPRYVVIRGEVVVEDFEISSEPIGRRVEV